jgi:hypothetical protein
MTRSARVGLRFGLSAVLFVVAASACQCDSFRFYEVTRAAVDECDILPQGEFCDEEGEGLSAPVFEIWAVEHRGDETRVIVDEEVWMPVVADPEAPDELSASKLEVSTVEPGPCTTTTTRSFVILADTQALSGEFAASTRLTGPDDCGETPRGQRSVATLAGEIAGAP